MPTVEICRKRSGNDRRTRALRKIFEPLHEMRSSRAPRPRARSLCCLVVATRAPEWREKQSAAIAQRTCRRRRRIAARYPRGRSRPVRAPQDGLCGPSVARRAAHHLSFSWASYHQIRVARDPQMLFRCNSGSSPGGSPPARSRNFVETTFLNFEIH